MKIGSIFPFMFVSFLCFKMNWVGISLEEAELPQKGKTGEKQAPAILTPDNESDVGLSSTETDVVRLCAGS